MPGRTALTPSERSYFENVETKAANAAAHGATALLLVAEEHIPWELRVRAARQLGASEWLPEHRSGRVKAVAYVSRAAAEQIIDQRLDEAVSRAGADLGSVVLRVRSEPRDVRSSRSTVGRIVLDAATYVPRLAARPPPILYALGDRSLAKLPPSGVIASSRVNGFPEGLERMQC